MGERVNKIQCDCNEIGSLFNLMSLNFLAFLSGVILNGTALIIKKDHDVFIILRTIAL